MPPYTPIQGERLTRLDIRLKKAGYRFYNIHDGFGQMAIFTTDYTYVPDTEFWVVDFVEKKLTGHHIMKALQTPNTTAYQFAEVTASNKLLRKQRRLRRRKQASDSQQSEERNNRRDKEQP